ncbi:RtcB family protein [Roseisolibacter sp. H3M3-2]|uniref:RtcB family protein n=1 Tax=Roseisolibacter sp. H3M3-2 TaxID=3031323 RepID=UPI0023DBE3EF|nr:RtcB family protein [Roseisolibacter sp. H3M3-2]MDF1504340.1 RtcB family protein [Roseisolibacter sp. H3M3-2]
MHTPEKKHDATGPRIVDGIAVFGEHEAGTLDQMRAVSRHTAHAALMADAHHGFVMPVGGVAAYHEQVSVMGVGVDIACLAGDTPVVCADGRSRAIRDVRAADPVTCCDAGAVRPVAPNLGAIARGTRPTLRLSLANGRALVATPDHEILTRDGWREAGALRPGDRVACVVHTGLPDAPHAPFEIAPGALTPHAAGVLAGRGWLPFRTDDPRLAPLLRLLGYVCGDGHLTRDGKFVSAYTTQEEDGAALLADFAAVGFPATCYRRQRRPEHRPEVHVRVASTALHALLASLGAPVGKKAWPARPMPWLFALPAWARAQFLSGFASAEMTTPRTHANGVVPNLQVKQAGEVAHAIEFVAALLRSLGFETSVAESGPPRGARRTWVVQVLGGQAAQVRFAAEVGFCHAPAKRRAAARVASVVWEREVLVRTRDAAKAEARARHAGGERWRDVMRDVAARHGVEEGFVYHAIYDRRGASRRLPGAAVDPQVDGEACWVRVASVEDAGDREVFDVVTGDPAHSFLAAGVVVHNCGNAAIRTDRTLADLGPTPEKQKQALEHLADEIAGTLSFGMGRRNRADDAPTDDPLFEDPAWRAVPGSKKEVGALKTKARQQLGTIGGGNHYVDVFADEAGALWVGVHFGSRGLGHTVATGFTAIAQGKRWGERAAEQETLLHLGSPSGDDYWELMHLAGRYAYVGREWVARKVVAMMGARELELVHNHHNWAWRETHDGRDLIVVRKGATPAFPGQLGFVGGSMGDDAVIIRGADPSGTGADDVRAAQRAALFSTVHGAGRVLSRTAAAGKRDRKTGRVLRPGAVSPAMMEGWLRERDVILRGGGLDESPHAYRRLPDVLAAQGDTIEVLHTLRPLVVVMAGADEFDPYKD